MGRVASLLLGLGVSGLFACSGADGTQLFDDAGQPITDATAPDTSNGKDGGGPDKDVTVQDVTIVDVVVPDVPVLPPDSMIHCGTSSCSAQTQVCCATYGTTTTFKCVSSESDCTGTQQVPISCSSGDNCASQGNADYICCASGQGPQNQNPNCQQFSVAAQVQCQSTCDANVGEFEVGCSTQPQNCADTSQFCITSKCTLPGLNICQ
jgi:hypothetical protein